MEILSRYKGMEKEGRLVATGLLFGIFGTFGAVVSVDAEEREALKEQVAQSLYEQSYDDCLRGSEEGKLFLDARSDAPGSLGLGNTMEFDVQQGGTLNFTLERVGDKYILQPGTIARTVLESFGCTSPVPTE